MSLIITGSRHCCEKFSSSLTNWGPLIPKHLLRTDAVSQYAVIVRCDLNAFEVCTFL